MSFIHVDDAVQALYLAATTPAAIGHSFNVVDDAPISFPSFAQQFAQHLGYHPRVLNILPMFAPFAPLADLSCF